MQDNYTISIQAKQIVQYVILLMVFFVELVSRLGMGKVILKAINLIINVIENDLKNCNLTTLSILE